MWDSHAWINGPTETPLISSPAFCDPTSAYEHLCRPWLHNALCAFSLDSTNGFGRKIVKLTCCLIISNLKEVWKTKSWLWLFKSPDAFILCFSFFLFDWTTKAKNKTHFILTVYVYMYISLCKIRHTKVIVVNIFFLHKYRGWCMYLVYCPIHSLYKIV